MTSSTDWSESLIGYLTHICKGDQYWGGLLVVDIEGDPVDFAWTEPVEVSRLIRPLFGDRVAGTIVSKTFARGLVDALEREPDLLCLNEPSLLSRNMSLDIPLAVLAPSNTPNGGNWVRTKLSDARPRGLFWFGERGEEELVESILNAAARHFAPFDLDEPFQRLRLALEQRTGNGEGAE